MQSALTEFRTRLTRFLFAGFDLVESPGLRRRLLLLYLFVTVCVGLFTAFAAVQLFGWHNATMGLVDSTVALLNVVAVIDLRRNHAVERAAFVSTMAAGVFFVAFVQDNQGAQSGLLWTALMPYFLIVIHGDRRGLLLTLLFIAATCGTAASGIGEWQEGRWSHLDVVRLTLILLLLTMQVYSAERTVRRTAEEVARTRAKEHTLLSQLRQQSETDALTGIRNRRSTQAALLAAHARACEDDLPLSLALFDLDHFKQVNDGHGHAVGDKVLKTFVRVGAARLRANDVFGRWGGEEFVVILPGAPAEAARRVCERIRVAVANTQFDHGEPLTVSVGVATRRANETIDQLLAQADRALYAAKSGGRNRTAVAD